MQKTMLIEQGSQLGGTMTSGGVDYPALFHAWGKQVIAGIGWNLVKKTVSLNGSKMPDFTEKHQQVSINKYLYAMLAEEACLESGVILEYYQFPLTVQSKGDGWLLDVVGKSTQYSVSCNQLIDCTGGADIVGMLGFERLRGEVAQPGTLMFKLGGYDKNKLDGEKIQHLYEEALSDGRLKKGDYAHTKENFVLFLKLYGRNAQHIFGADSSTSIAQTKANIAGRSSLLRLLRFVRSLPGCENTRVELMSPETGIRETYRILGETVITADDYTSGRVFDDAVCYSFYPIDVHDEKGVKPVWPAEGTVATIPLSALVPKGSRNLLVAGRSVSSDRFANSAARVQASCMAMGQAAGVTAALAARNNMTPLEVKLDIIREELRRYGAIVPLV